MINDNINCSVEFMQLKIMVFGVQPQDKYTLNRVARWVYIHGAAVLFFSAQFECASLQTTNKIHNNKHLNGNNH